MGEALLGEIALPGVTERLGRTAGVVVGLVDGDGRGVGVPVVEEATDRIGHRSRGYVTRGEHVPQLPDRVLAADGAVGGAKPLGPYRVLRLEGVEVLRPG